MSVRRERVVEIMRAGQETFARALEECDDQARFEPHRWSRPGGGGGEARILEDGRVFERAGVNVSAVHGDEVPATIAAEHGVDPSVGFFATGLSIVVHPRNPYVPSFHANFRYFEMGGHLPSTCRTGGRRGAWAGSSSTACVPAARTAGSAV